MGASIFQNMQSQKQNNVLSQVQEIKKLLSGNDANAVMKLMMQRNPQFAQFANECRGLSAEQICQKYGVDYNSLKGLLSR